MCIAANSVFKISSNRFIVITILFSMSAQPAAAAGFVFLTGEDDVERQASFLLCAIYRPTAKEVRSRTTVKQKTCYIQLS